MNATDALNVFRNGKTVSLKHGNGTALGTVDGTALQMETARMRRHRKMVLRVGVRYLDSNGRYTGGAVPRSRTTCSTFFPTGPARARGK